MRMMMMNKNGFMIGLLITVVALLIISCISYGLIYAFTTGHETILVKEKWVKYSGEDAKYLVSSEDGQVFQITDSIIKLRFDSSNLYAQLDEGKTYNINTQGWRFALLSDYKNIIDVEWEQLSIS